MLFGRIQDGNRMNIYQHIRVRTQKGHNFKEVIPRPSEIVQDTVAEIMKNQVLNPRIPAGKGVFQQLGGLM
jgi:hypothetical protein